MSFYFVKSKQNFIRQSNRTTHPDRAFHPFILWIVGFKLCGRSEINVFWIYNLAFCGLFGDLRIGDVADAVVVDVDLRAVVKLDRVARY